MSSEKFYIYLLLVSPFPTRTLQFGPALSQLCILLQPPHTLHLVPPMNALLLFLSPLRSRISLVCQLLNTQELTPGSTRGKCIH